MQGIQWVVGDGCEVCFWSDRWLSSDRLVDRTEAALPLEFADIRVKDLWTDGRGWVMEQILPYVKPDIILELSAVVVDNVTGAKDRMSWGRTANGEFTVKSAYALLTTNNSVGPDESNLYNRIWHVIAPERTRMFLWLVVHRAIMTNVECHRRHFRDSSMCQICKGGDEKILHILRDCPSIKGIWERIVPMRKRTEFFQSSLLDWIYVNLGSSDVVDGCAWPTLYAMGIWWSWKWSCGNIFGEVGRCRDRTKFVKDIAKEVQRSHEVHKPKSGAGPGVEQMIAWKCPSEGWWKLNTDGAVRGNLGLAAVGGVLRDAGGNWCVGFSLNIGVCSAPLAELWGIYYGLYIVWERSARRVELEIDSRMVVEFLTSGISNTHPLSFLVRLCHGFLSRDWTVRISHVYREANRLADGLANHAFSLSLGFHFFDSIPVVVDPLWREDFEGLAIARRVHL